MTFADGVAKAITVIGPRGARRAVGSWAAGGFLRRPTFALRVREVDRAPRRMSAKKMAGLFSNASAQQLGGSAAAPVTGDDITDFDKDMLCGFRCLDESGEAAGSEWWGGVVPVVQQPPIFRHKRAVLEHRLMVLPVLSDPYRPTRRPKAQANLHVSRGSCGITLSPTFYGSDSHLPLAPWALEELFSSTRMRERTASTSNDDDSLVEYPAQLEDQQPSLSYICRTPDQRGKFDVKKAKALGVPPGPLFGKLTRGEPVTLASGKVVQPSDVLGAGSAGSVFMVIDCPSLAHLAKLREDAALQAASRDELVLFVFHMTPRAVLQSESYMEWMATLGTVKDTQHVLMCEGYANDCISYFMTQKHTQYLRLLCPNEDIFHIPQGGSFSRGEQAPKLPVEGTVYASPLQRFDLTPQRPRFFDHVAEEHRIRVDSATMAETARRTLLIRDLLPDIPMSTDPNVNFTTLRPGQTLPPGGSNAPCVTFLGTGSAIPSNYRNVTSMLVHSNSAACAADRQPPGHAPPWAMLVDCGEGSLGQLFRRFGQRATESILVDYLQCITITHMHADHHLGLVRVLLERQKLFATKQESGQVASDVHQAPLLVLGPEALGAWLTRYSENCEPLRFSFMTNAQVFASQEEDEHASATVTAAMARCGMTSLRLVPVVHTRDAWGVSLVGRQESMAESAAEVAKSGAAVATPQWGFVFSGDTRPCRTLIQEAVWNATQTQNIGGGNNTMLVHEATLEDSMQQDARAKNHSTTGDALSVGRRAQPNQLVLTHFSQRYPKCPEFVDLGAPAAEDEMTLLRRPLVAFDFMTLRIGDHAQHIAYSNAMPNIRRVIQVLEEEDDPETELGAEVDEVDGSVAGKGQAAARI